MKTRRAFYRSSVLVALTCTLTAVMTVASAQTVTRVGSSLNLAPFEFVDVDGKPQGFELEILEAVGERLGLEFEYVKTPFSQAFTGLLADKYRLNASAIFITCERLEGKGIEFTVPTYSEGHSISVRSEDADRVRSMDDLRGVRVGVESKGSTADALADAHKDTIGFSKQIYPDTTALFLALEQGRIDAAIQSQLVSQYAIRNKPSMVVATSVPGTERPSGLVFRKGDPMIEAFDGAIDALKREGELAKIYRKWFGVDPGPDSMTAKVTPRITLDTCAPKSVL